MILSIAISGADDSVDPKDLAVLSDEYPFVEWNIALQSRSSPQPARPSIAWLEALVSLSERMRLIGHLQSRWKRDIVDCGYLSLRDEYPHIWSALKKIRIDIGEASPINLLDAFQVVDKDFILCVDDIKNNTLQMIKKRTKVIPLIRGEWREIPDCGYLIDFDNLESALSHFSESKSEVWICVKGFRGDDGVSFDLDKVERCLDLAEDYVTSDRWLKSVMETTEGKRKAISVYPSYKV
jgi:hypothetical protein